MKLKIFFTDEYMEEEVNKTLCFLQEGQFFLSNIIDIKPIEFFQ